MDEYLGEDAADQLLNGHLGELVCSTWPTARRFVDDAMSL